MRLVYRPNNADTIMIIAELRHQQRPLLLCLRSSRDVIGTRQGILGEACAALQDVFSAKCYARVPLPRFRPELFQVSLAFDVCWYNWYWLLLSVCQLASSRATGRHVSRAELLAALLGCFYRIICSASSGRYAICTVVHFVLLV